jgi:hypothetical protein
MCSCRTNAFDMYQMLAQMDVDPVWRRAWLGAFFVASSDHVRFI